MRDTEAGTRHTIGCIRHRGCRRRDGVVTLEPASGSLSALNTRHGSDLPAATTGIARVRM
jgi:hypothetical protein